MLMNSSGSPTKIADTAFSTDQKLAVAVDPQQAGSSTLVPTTSQAVQAGPVGLFLFGPLRLQMGRAKRPNRLDRVPLVPRGPVSRSLLSKLDMRTTWRKT